MHEILIIGTVPPCPRCKLLTGLEREMVKEMKLDAEVRHIAYTDPEAEKIGRTMGLTPGTAKEVAKVLGEDVALDKMPKASEVSPPAFLQNVDPYLKQFEQLFREVNILDDWLRSFEDRAKDAGILMTPVLMVDGEMLHNGSVPEPERIRQWLSQLQ